MADLDDFFAKKDKRKKGKGKKYTTSNSIAASLESQPQPQPEQKDAKIDITTDLTQDDEWKEDVEPSQDLEGLKVQSLRLDSEDATERTVPDSVGDSTDPDEEHSEARWKEKQLVWQIQHPDEPETDIKDVPQPPPEKPASTTYVPPALRGGVKLSMHKSKRAPPDLQNVQAFPSLSTSAQLAQSQKPSEGPKEKDFREVRSSRATKTVDTGYAGLKLTNKYSSLSNN